MPFSNNCHMHTFIGYYYALTMFVKPVKLRLFTGSEYAKTSQHKTHSTYLL